MLTERRFQRRKAVFRSGGFRTSFPLRGVLSTCGSACRTRIARFACRPTRSCCLRLIREHSFPLTTRANSQLSLAPG